MKLSVQKVAHRFASMEMLSNAKDKLVFYYLLYGIRFGEYLMGDGQQKKEG